MIVPAKSVKLYKSLTKFSMFGTVFLSILAVASIVGFIFLKIQYSQIANNINILKKRIVELEKNEQKLILAKDKLSKIEYILSLDAIDVELSDFKDFQNSISSESGILFSDISIDPQKTEVALSIKDTNQLSSVLKNIGLYAKKSSVILSSLGFNSNSGYLVALIFKD